MTERIRRFVAHPAVKAGYLLLLLLATGFYLVRWGDRLPDLLSQVRPASVGAAFVVTLLSALLYSYIQTYIYRQLGARPTYWTVFRIVTISQLGKYLPGKVLFVGNYYLFSREAGIKNVQIGTSFIISMALWMLTASLCALPVLGLLEPAFRYLILILPLLLALFIHPRFLGWLLKITRRTFGRLRRTASGDPAASTAGTGDSDEFIELSVASYLRAAFLYLATWALAGLGAYLCLAAFVPVRLEIYPLALASIALGTVAGFLALFAPVGLGVREGIGALVLAPVVGADVALLSMVLLRGITVTVDLVLALVAMIAGRWVESGSHARDLPVER
jgi:uncharacterized membrane protein YbhN (UPF0104 family)